MLNRSPRPVIAGLLYLCVAAMLGSVSCTRAERDLGDSLASDGDPGFASESNLADATAPEVDAFRPLCKSTACPSPYATCPNDAFQCETNVDSDSNHCGACGNACPQGDAIRQLFGAEWFCESGRCRMVCDIDSGHADCNSLAADGCETDTLCDAENCGGCGVKCGAGERCIKGQCGCRPGLTACDDFCFAQCLSLDSDDHHCGTCETDCPPEPPPPQAHARLGCVDSQCGRLKCQPGFLDCNGDLESAGDGCETSVNDDPRNCGGCGKACTPDQTCNGGRCVCGPDESACPSWFGGIACANLDTNIYNCGACSHQCQAPADGSAKPICVFGQCELECPSGYANCDGQAGNGCETFVGADPRNCGACGVQCDLAFGQPCVNGSCLIAPCESGPTQ